MVLVKTCGITSLRDALACVRAGADMLGFNFYPESPRYISPRDARSIIERLPPSVVSVGVFVNEGHPRRVIELADLAGVTALQLHGDEPPAYCHALAGRYVIKAVHVTDDFSPEQAARYAVKAVLLDSSRAGIYGGTGETFNWEAARAARPVVPKLFLAGGLGPENVAAAAALVRPYAVDACSSLERVPGRKDERRVKAFVVAARSP